jgi:ATP-dependent DNA helicase RecG
MLTLRFFYFSKAQQEQPGSRGTAAALLWRVRAADRAGLEMVHPEYQFLGAEEQVSLEQALTPVYPTTEGLQQFRHAQPRDPGAGALPATASRLAWRAGCRMAAHCRACTRRCRSCTARRRGSMLARLRRRPSPGAATARAGGDAGAPPQPAAAARARPQRGHATPLPAVDGLRERFLAGLGFGLTAGQQEALAEIDADLAQPQPMLRLVQGDVGCGKTVVAAAAALRAVENGHQVAVMAPTELLAEQHRARFSAGWSRWASRSPG